MLKIECQHLKILWNILNIEILKIKTKTPYFLKILKNDQKLNCWHPSF